MIRDVYGPFAAKRRRQVAKLPKRPSTTASVELALLHEKERLRSELVDAKPGLVITLGNEARAVLAGVLDEGGEGLSGRLDRNAYGERTTGSVSGVSFDCLSLKHPGQTGELWRGVHEEWVGSIE